jgi:hypothetical protein
MFLQIRFGGEGFTISAEARMTESAIIHCLASTKVSCRLEK